MVQTERPTGDRPARQRIVLVTGPSGAGRSTAIHVLEDLGYEAIDNLPMSLLSRLLDGPPIERPLALGLDVRNRDFSVDGLLDVMSELGKREAVEPQLLYLDCDEDVLVRRYSETRRRHPLAPDRDPISGIRHERDMLIPIRARADILIDTSALSPHDLKEELGAYLAPEADTLLAVSVQSFSYKRGLPRGADIVLDCRFLRNPHWEASLRALDGRDEAVASFVEADPRFEAFFSGVRDLALFLLPAYTEEGKSHLSIALGCTGGQHRSVAVAEKLAKALAEQGWQVSKRHREMERRAELPTAKREVAG